MVDTAQVIYEYSAGLSVSFFTDDFTMEPQRSVRVADAVDGTLITVDKGYAKRIFTCSALLDGDTWKTLHDVQIGSITYSGAYPRLTTINFDGDTTITNVEVVMTRCQAQDLNSGLWLVAVEFMEKDQ